MTLKDDDDFDAIFGEKDDTPSEPIEEEDLGLGDEEIIETSEKKKEKKSTDFKRDKSFKNLQRYTSKVEKELEEIKEQNRKRDEAEKLKTQKLIEAFGLENEDDKKAKEIIQEYESNPIGFIDSRIDEALSREISPIKKDVSMGRVERKVDKILEDIENKYEFNLTPELDDKIAKILKTRFTNDFKEKHPEEAILNACAIALGKKELTERKIPFVDRGKSGDKIPTTKNVGKVIQERIYGRLKNGKKKANVFRI